MSNPVTGTTYLRVLPYRVIVDLSRELDKSSVSNKNWKGVASQVKKKNGQDRYSLGLIHMFEMELQRGKSPTESLISDWGTSNATVQDLVDILEELELLSSIDILLPDYNCKVQEQEVVHQTPDSYTSMSPHKPTEPAPMSPEPSNAELYDQLINNGFRNCGFKLKTMDVIQQFNFISIISSINDGKHPPSESWNRPTAVYEDEVSSSTDKQPCEDSSLPHLPQQHDKAIQYLYQDLCEMTDQFNDSPLSKGGCWIGEGGFGTVYRGIFAGNKACAVKRLKKEILSDEKMFKQFTMEHTTLSNLKHPNLVGLYGYSYDGPNLCLVFEYVVNGSLNECLACKDSHQKPLQWSTRISIAQGAAQGICFLHQNGHIHRDIKSANILLDEQLNAKIGDFGLVKALPQHAVGTASMNSSASTTNTVIGSPVYMAPEAMFGKFSKKSDSFSFGVVLLELMTGLAVLNHSREYPDIITHVDYKMQAENTDFIKLMDKKMEHNFGEESVRKMHGIATGFLVEKVFKRLELSTVLDELMQL